jgi:hypothetical protein
VLGRDGLEPCGLNCPCPQHQLAGLQDGERVTSKDSQLIMLLLSTAPFLVRMVDCMQLLGMSFI